MKSIRKRLMSIVVAFTVIGTCLPALKVSAVQTNEKLNNVQASGSTETVDRKVVAYFPEWGYANENRDYYTVDRMPWDKMTHINYAFAHVGTDNKIAIGSKEAALEKATASRGLLAVQYNEADLYGYTDENLDALSAFEQGKDSSVPWSYGLGVIRLVMAAYLSAERKQTVDLTDPATLDELETYVPAIAKGEGADLLY